MASRKRPNPFDSLEDDARVNSARKGPRCSVAVLLEVVFEEMGEEATMSIIRTLRNHRLSTASIHRALETRVEPDLLPGPYSLGRHRKGACSCPRD